jgi:integrase/recombinase XerD
MKNYSRYYSSTQIKQSVLIAAIHFFQGQKSVKSGFSANSLAQTFALLYEGAGLEGASSHSGRRTFLTNLANKGTAIHILKTLAGHRSISTTAAYLYSSPSQLKAAVELV